MNFDGEKTFIIDSNGNAPLVTLSFVNFFFHIVRPMQCYQNKFLELYETDMVKLVNLVER